MDGSQTKITGGKVSFGLTVCPKQYESKRVDVEFSFTVKEDDTYEAIFDRACVAAMKKAGEMVGLIEVKPSPVKPAVSPPAKAESTGLFG